MMSFDWEFASFVLTDKDLKAHRVLLRIVTLLFMLFFLLL
jgi:hypothetical protein